MQLPRVWTEKYTDHILRKLRLEAADWFRIHQLDHSIDEWSDYRDSLRKKIWNELGIKYDANVDLDLRDTGEIQMDGYVVKKVYYQSMPGFYVTGNLYIPDGEWPFPGVIGVHGHWAQGRLAERIQQRGHTLAKNGYVCFSVDAFGSGERSDVHGVYEYHGGMLGGSLLNTGETHMGIQVVDNMRAVDVLCSLTYVDSSKIGVTGASGGGNQTMWLSALDERIKAAVPVVSVGSFESYVGGSNCFCELLPNGLTFIEESGVLALIAPNALKICNCLGDSNPTFSPSEMLRSFKETRKIYRAHGMGQKLSYQVFNEPHGYWPDIREAMLGWFDLHLKGIGTGAPKIEQPFKVLKEEELMVFKKGQRPAEVSSIAQYMRKKGAELNTKMLDSSFDSEELKRNLKAMLKIHNKLELKHVHKYNEQDEWQKYALQTTCGRMIPVLLKAPAEGNEYYIAAAPSGKDKLLESDKFQRLLEQGKGIIAFDVYGAGETSEPRFPNYHFLSRAEMWLGRTMLGEWARDYELLMDWAGNFIKGVELTLFGYKEASVVAMAAAVTSNCEYDVLVDSAPLTYRFNKDIKSDFFTLALLVPGFLKWGDISLLAALSAGKVTFENSVLYDGEEVNETQKAEYRAEFKMVSGKVAGGLIEIH
ncbi:MAG: prolyl oligopeptidase family serine peptidase [Lentisphaerae bacterium]|nr:prolyl oligopeptidase family serine peptidase [Lentisphaerota bacterium]MCP4103705.1 prolyl oligopeptidase family serine peptidase [Lentisphaerota bacterium]